jgi:hypothetical protein
MRTAQHFRRVLSRLCELRKHFAGRKGRLAFFSTTSVQHIFRFDKYLARYARDERRNARTSFLHVRCQVLLPDLNQNRNVTQISHFALCEHRIWGVARSSEMSVPSDQTARFH